MSPLIEPPRPNMSHREREPLAPETMDGILFGLALMANPKIRARNEAFKARLKAFQEATAHKTKADMIAELKAHNQAYILSLLEANSEDEIRSRYVHTFVHLEPK